MKFTKEEANQIKEFDSPGMKLMGFKDKTRIKNYMNVRASYFLYPEETKIRGSSQVIHSLIVSMIKLEKVAIVRILPRQGAIVRFAALFPSIEPQGFNAIFLPYADDMRNPEILKSRGDVVKAPDNLVKRASNMVSNIQLGEYDPHAFFNPVLQHFYTNLEALALEEPKPPPVLDSLEPDQDGMQTKERFIKGFLEETLAGSRKRPSADGNQGKVNNGAKYTEEELKKMKIPELKEICGALNLTKGGKKDEIIERILNNS